MTVERMSTTVCIVGGGPAGMMAGFLFARAGVETIVLEKHADFFRDFRGDTIHPSTTEVLSELGVLDRFLELKPDRLEKIGAEFCGRNFDLADFSGLPTVCQYIAMIPQWDFLSFIADEAAKLPTFSLRMSTKATDLIEENGRIVGVRADSESGQIEVRSSLVIAADGRSSRMRECAGLRVENIGAPIDVLWFRIPRNENAADAEPLFHAGRGHVVITINRTTYWQCAYVVPKGTADEVKSRELSAFKKAVVDAAPVLGWGIEELRDFDDVRTLNVAIDRLEKWSRPGLLMIGDSAHAMSPVGGVGINLAIQDSVAAANLLADKLADGQPVDDELDSVRRRRLWPAKVTQWVQVKAQDTILDPIISDQKKMPRAPFPMRVISRIPFLQRRLGAMVGLGARPEHVQSRAAFPEA